MGYRHYFYLVNKKEVEDLRSMTYEELEKEFDADDYVDIHDIMDNEVFEFGKLYFDNTSERIYAKGEPFFTKKETQSQFEDYVPFIVGQDGVQEAIDIYAAKIRKYYREMLDPTQDTTLKLREHIEAMSKDWIGYNNRDILPFKLEDGKSTVADSWKYEYNIFELVNLYKNIDYSEYTIVFMGW